MKMIMGFLVTTAFISSASAADYHASWGIEQYSSCTKQNFKIKLTGTNPYLTRITGNIIGAAQAGATSAIVARDALVSFVNPTLQWSMPPVAVVIESPPATNHSVWNGLGSVIIKQTGTQVVNVRIDFVFDPPVRLPGGDIWFATDVQSYPGTQPTRECLDVEAQLLVQFTDTP